MASFVVDEDLPESLCQALRNKGHNAVGIREVRLQGSADQQVFDYAQALSAIIITEDLDFADTLAFPLGTHFGIIVLRISDQVLYSTRLNRVLEVIDSGLAKDLRGALAIVELTRVRVRRP